MRQGRLATGRTEHPFVIRSAMAQRPQHGRHWTGGQLGQALSAEDSSNAAHDV